MASCEPFLGHDPKACVLFDPPLNEKHEVLNAERFSVSAVSPKTAFHSSGPLLSEKFFSRMEV
jgi:hypothetical protein